MSKHKLEGAYEKLTGHPLRDQGNLKQTLCIQCAQRLINFSRFKDKSLRARALMMDLVEKHDIITRQHIEMINHTKLQLKSNLVLTTLGPDHCDLHIEHPSEDKQTELKETGHRFVVKVEGSDDDEETMWVDVDVDMKSEDYINIHGFVQDPLKYEGCLFQCTLCLEEFVHEHAYMQHMRMHLRSGGGDGECDTSQCEPRAAVSSSHSSLVAENRSVYAPVPITFSSSDLLYAVQLQKNRPSRQNPAFPHTPRPTRSASHQLKKLIPTTHTVQGTKD
nr:uncharacterized protein LOC117990814 [Maniola hyperantus]